jgi:hypothetical protein
LTAAARAALVEIPEFFYFDRFVAFLLLCTRVVGVVVFVRFELFQLIDKCDDTPIAHRRKVFCFLFGVCLSGGHEKNEAGGL